MGLNIYYDYKYTSMFLNIKLVLSLCLLLGFYCFLILTLDPQI